MKKFIRENIHNFATVYAKRFILDSDERESQGLHTVKKLVFYVIPFRNYSRLAAFGT
jgi:hypothetical protein